VYSLFSRVPLSFGFLVNCRVADCIGYGDFGMMDILVDFGLLMISVEIFCFN
jgi:hypothetical protein